MTKKTPDLRKFRVSGEVSYPFVVELSAFTEEEACAKVEHAGFEGGIPFEELDIQGSPKYAEVRVDDSEEIE